MAEENSNITSPPPVTNTSQNSKERTSSNTPVITKTALLSTPLNIGTNINSEKQLAKSSPSLNQESSSSNEQSRQNSTLKKSMFGSLRVKFK